MNVRFCCFSKHGVQHCNAGGLKQRGCGKKCILLLLNRGGRVEQGSWNSHKSTFTQSERKCFYCLYQGLLKVCSQHHSQKPSFKNVLSMQNKMQRETQRVAFSRGKPRLLRTIYMVYMYLASMCSAVLNICIPTNMFVKK